MKTSAGLLVYRIKNGQPEVLIARMGGPWFAKKEKGAWSIPKGEYEEGQDPKETARREFTEELSKPVPEGTWKDLGTVRQNNNKEVVAWALEGDLDVTNTKSNTFKVEWPPRSGQLKEYPEIERAEWVSLAEAATRLVSAQVGFLERLANELHVPFGVKEIPKPPKQSSLF